jgi:ribosomal protein L44E
MQLRLTFLQHLVYSATCDIVCICETWLNATVLSSELLPGYSIFRRDRVRKIGGGVLMAVKNNIHVTRRLDLRCRCRTCAAELQINLVIHFLSSS